MKLEKNVLLLSDDMGNNKLFRKNKRTKIIIRCFG